MFTKSLFVLKRGNQARFINRESVVMNFIELPIILLHGFLSLFCYKRVWRATGPKRIGKCQVIPHCPEWGRGICQNFTDEDHTRVKSIAQLSRYDDMYTYSRNWCVIHFTGYSWILGHFFQFMTKYSYNKCLLARLLHYVVWPTGNCPGYLILCLWM